MITAASVTSNSGATATKPTYWVAAFDDISTGNLTAQGDAAITCDRTQWLG